jgi:hypothetical protein
MRVLLAASALLLAACDAMIGGAGHRPSDPWHAPAPRDLATWNWRQVPLNRILMVPPANLAEAEGMLATLPAVELDAAKAAHLAGRALLSVEGARPWLVRGLLHRREPPSFTLYAYGNQLDVRHRTPVKDLPPPQRQPLIVLLEASPERVYVTVDLVN